MKEGVLLIILIIALLTDLKSGKIYNWLTFPGIIIGIIWHTAAAATWEMGLFDSLAGLILGMGFFFSLWCMEKFAGGDVKLFGVIGAFTGLRFTAWALGFTLAAGALVALILLVRRGKLLSTLNHLVIGTITKTIDTGKLSTATVDRRYPYSIAIILGALVTYFSINFNLLRLPF